MISCRRPCSRPGTTWTASRRAPTCAPGCSRSCATPTSPNAAAAGARWRIATATRPTSWPCIPGQQGHLDMQDFRRALNLLPPDQREALVLVGAAGFSYEEAAAISGCAVGTIKSRVNRARSKLTELLGVTTAREFGPGFRDGGHRRPHRGCLSDPAGQSSKPVTHESRSIAGSALFRAARSLAGTLPRPRNVFGTLVLKPVRRDRHDRFDAAARRSDPGAGRCPALVAPQPQLGIRAFGTARLVLVVLLVIALLDRAPIFELGVCDRTKQRTVSPADRRTAPG